jgi:hypothetical protein
MITSANNVIAAGQHEHGSATANSQERTLKVGKNGEMTFDTETKVGDITLKPGRYRFQHRVEGEDHFVHFTQWTAQNPYRPGETGAPKAHPGEVHCRIEPLAKKAAQTKVSLQKEDSAYRLVRVEVAGENVAHLF